MSNKNRKYLPGGSLNPAWIDEQEVNRITNNIIDNLWELFSGINAELNINLTEGVNLTVSNQKQNTNNMCSIIDKSDMDYESKFDFIKRHSANPEDLKLAREIVGL